MTILLATTCHPYKYTAANAMEYLAWLAHADKLTTRHDVELFAALELDGRGVEAHEPLLSRMQAFAESSTRLGSDFWTFSVNDRATEITSGNRLKRICTGRNLIMEYANERQDVTHILFADTDVEIPAGAIDRLLEVNWSIVGGEVPTYCLSGPEIAGYPFPVQQHWNAAGFLMIDRFLVRRLRWGWDLDGGTTDDPWFQARAADMGWPTRVRKDVIGLHHPACIPPVEHRGLDRRIR